MLDWTSMQDVTAIDLGKWEIWFSIQLCSKYSTRLKESTQYNLNIQCIITISKSAWMSNTIIFSEIFCATNQLHKSGELTYQSTIAKQFHQAIPSPLKGLVRPHLLDVLMLALGYLQVQNQQLSKGSWLALREINWLISTNPTSFQAIIISGWGTGTMHPRCHIQMQQSQILLYTKQMSCVLQLICKSLTTWLKQKDEAPKVVEEHQWPAQLIRQLAQNPYKQLPFRNLFQIYLTYVAATCKNKVQPQNKATTSWEYRR